MAKKANKTFRITGRVIDRTTQQGIAGLRVEAWDKDLICNDLVGSSVTEKQGAFQIEFTSSYFKELFLDQEPDLFFKVFREAELIKSTEDSVLWNVAAGNSEVVIEVNVPAIAPIDVPAAAKAEETSVVRGKVCDADGRLLEGIVVRAFAKHLRSEELVGDDKTEAGEYTITYPGQQFLRGEKGNAGLVIKAFTANDSLLAASPVLFNAPLSATVGLIIPAEMWPPLTMFEKIERALVPLLEGLKVEELEEDKEHQDLSFLSGETGFERNTLARFVIAHMLAQQSIQPEFWFAVLGGSFFQFAENQSLKDQSAAILDSLSSLDAAALRKSLTRALNQKEIPEAFREKVADWIEAFLKFIASHAVSGSTKPTFIKLALDHAGIEGAEKQEKFARLFNEYKGLTPELLASLEKDKSFKETEIADVRTSFQLSDLTGGDFSIVKMLKEEFDVRQPEKIRSLAKKGESEWVNLVKEKHATGDIKLPFEGGEIAGQIGFPAAEVYGKTLARQFREAFPSTAFAGGLERALSNGGTQGVRNAVTLSKFLQRYEEFEFLNTPVDDFLTNNIDPDFPELAKNEDFRLEVKAVQRVFKLAPTFEATDALLADGLHSSAQIYRMGESEFVRRYGDSAGFTAESARLAWNRAADTNAAVLTIVADLKALEAEALPLALQNNSAALKNFPNWNNLFQTGDLCECEQCRSILGPAAYFADMLMFLKDRKQPIPDNSDYYSAKDILFHRRPDLGFLELNCDNGLTPLPYIDVVCEVLENAVDAKRENDLELTGMATVPAVDLETAVKKVFEDAFANPLNDRKERIELGGNISLSQLNPASSHPNQWVLHSDNVTYLLEKRARLLPQPSEQVDARETPHLFAEILRNTKAGAAELRAYPQYVNPKAYEKLRAAKYPSDLPFDLFAEEVRAAFQKTNLQRWDLMRTLRSGAAPNNPTDGDIAAEYFDISADAAATFDERCLILKADPTDDGQKAVWGETRNPNWLDTTSNVKTFLQKTGLEYSELLALLDLRFINENRDIAIQDLDTSCDTDKKVIQFLDPTKLDRIHRFLRLWRKLKGWKMWELDLVIRHPRIGDGSLDERFLINLFYFSEVRNKLGGNTTIEQVCALFGDLNTPTRFTKLHEKREDGLYQYLFVNKKLINPLDSAFRIHPQTGDLFEIDPNNGERMAPLATIGDHVAITQAALGIPEADLLTFRSLTKALDGSAYIKDDINDPLDPKHLKNGLNLANLSFLWRHAWLAKMLKFTAQEWKTILRILPEDVRPFVDLAAAQHFLDTKYHIKAAGLTQAEVDAILLKIFRWDVFDLACPKAALELLERIQHLKDTGFTADELSWLLAADHSAKTAVKEADATRFLTALRKELRGIHAEYDPAQYDFLTAATNEEQLIRLLTTLLQKLNRDAAALAVFIKTLRGSVLLEASAQDLPTGFAFPAAITAGANHIPVQYDEQPVRVLRFTGLMNDAQRTTLLDDASPALATLRKSGELKAAVPSLVMSLPFPPAAITGIPIQYRVLEKDFLFSGLMTDAQWTTLLSHSSLGTLVNDLVYRTAIEDLYQQSLRVLITYRSAIEELYQQSLTAATNYVSTEIKIPLAGGITLPVDHPSIPVRYDVQTQKLSFAGVMTNAEQAALKAIPANASASAAIDELFQRPRLAVKFYEPVFTAPLEILPPAVDFKAQLTAELAAKTTYDAEQRLLRFTGIMSNDELAALNHLVPVSPANAAYHTALASLAEQPQRPPPDKPVWLTESDLDQPTNSDTNTAAKRMARAIRKALVHLSMTFAENSVVQQSSDTLGLAPAMVREVMTRFALIAPEPILEFFTGAFSTTSGALDYAGFKNAFDRWYWVNRVAVILKKWKINLEEFEALISLQTPAQLLDFRTLPIDDAPLLAPPIDTFLRTNRLLKMRDTMPGSSVTLLEVLEKLNNGSYGTAAAFAADVERLNGAWLAADVQALTASLDLSYPKEYLLAESWERLRRAFYFLDNLNAGADTVKVFAAPAMTDIHAKTVKELLRSKFGTETWLTLSTEIQDSLRERKRDALAAFLLNQRQPDNAPSRKWEDTNDLYAYYLLDVEMSSCQLTSRLVQASGSVQLFVQRCFMGLEPDVVVQADGENGSAWRWWKWMRKYQVWVANRKVFLWPENWIEPELKKDRSPFFKDMENELVQNEITQFTAETAFSNYLQKLDGVAQLEIAGFFQEDDGDNAIVHVFGRTAGAEPHLYYYRRYDYRQWTPWEKVELDIQGDYLIPGVVNSRLFLFWPVFSEVPEEKGNSRINVPTPGQKRFTPDKTSKKLKLQMAVSDYRQGKWTPKRLSKDFDESHSYNVEIVRQHYQFFFIDHSNVDGRIGIQYEGYSVAGNTKAALDQAAIDAKDDEQLAARDKVVADRIFYLATHAFGYVQLALKLAKSLIVNANDLLAGNQGLGANPGATAGWADTYKGAVNDPKNQAIIARDNYLLQIPPPSPPIPLVDTDENAVQDARTFVDALTAVQDAFEEIRKRGSQSQPYTTVQLIPLIKTAQEGANAGVDAGTDALTSTRNFRDAAAEAARSAGKELTKATALAEGAQAASDNFKPDDTHQAILSGVFEISGCTGVPEKAGFLRRVPPVIRPEPASVGSDTDFLKWVELVTESPLPVTQHDDLTLLQFLPATAQAPFLNRTRSVPVLGKTPGIFKVSPAWHLSYFDGLWSDGNVGALLPSFYNDGQRTFFVPSLIWSANVSELSSAFGNAVCNYPDIMKAVQGLPESDLHTALIKQTLLNKLLTNQWFHFKNFYHPYVCKFARLVNNPLKGIPALMSRETQLTKTHLKTPEFRFGDIYEPAESILGKLVESYNPKEDVDFTPDGSYSPYNWELFFHAPLLIANSLSKNQRFEEAREWYHFIFNPIGVESGTPGGSPMSKYWITKPFFETTDPQYVHQRIDNILRMLAGDVTLQDYSPQAKTALEDQVFDWRTNPFEPHRLANYRTVAYQKTVVMKYLDNLVAWGDNLFRQDSMESINEATQLYVLAAEILGPRPKRIPPSETPPLESFNELEMEFDKFSNALVNVENLVPVLSVQNTDPRKGPEGSERAPLPNMLYFCIPQNDKLLGYWDTMADRLYKIRHCMNIEGVVRQLGLFEPPIDPAALVKAVAAGLDVSSALADLNAPLPLYRFNVLLQKANEVCNDVKALGAALLAALEKNDAEAMGQLRQSQELVLLEAVKAVREKQIEEAKENLAGARRSREMAETKEKYYENKEFMNALENASAALAGGAIGVSALLAVNEVLASIFFLLPSFNLGISGFGGSPQVTATWGSENIAKGIQATNASLQHGGSILSQRSSMVATTANFQRRKEEWDFQKDLAIKEGEQIDKSIAAAELRIAIAEKELENHVIQIENARAIDAFMRSKYTNQELYQWQVGQISGVYFQSYKLAYDLAKRAERCFRFELGLQDSSYINFGYWDSLKNGLLSGEKLQYDLRRLETAYLEQNRREFELTKHVSLALLDPLSLLKVRETGRCFFRLPEEIFDLDYPGHYFRRIKSVSLTLPCVVGPYTTISCTLRLLKNSIRVNTANGDKIYPRNTDGDSLPADDPRFVENNISVKAVAASNAQNDSGVFELSFRDERYLPFEGAGAVSEWSLELFNDANADFGKPLRQFDYGTISDAILHVKYTAREDAGPFKNGAIAHLRDYLSKDGETPSLRMFNLRQEFPTQWHRFLNPTGAAANIFELEMSANLFRTVDAGKTLKLNTIWLLARCTDMGSYSVKFINPAPDPDTMTLSKMAQYGGLHFSQRDIKDGSPPILPTGPLATWKLQMTRPGGANLREDPARKTMEVEDLILVLGYEWEPS